MRRAAFGAVGEGRDRGVAARRLCGRGRDLAAACRSAATPMRSSTSARPIGSAAACRSTSAPRKTWFERAASERPSRRRRPRSACCCSRTATRPRASNGSSRPPSKASRARCWSTAPRSTTATASPRTAMLGYAYVSRAAAQGLAPAKDTLAQLDQLMPLADRQKARRARARQGRRPRRRRAAQAGKAGRSAQAEAAPSPKAGRDETDASARRSRRRRSPHSGAWRIQLGAFSQRGVGRSALPASWPARPRWPAAALLYRRPARSPGFRSGRSRARPPPPRPAARSGPPASRSRRNS